MAEQYIELHKPSKILGGFFISTTILLAKQSRNTLYDRNTFS